MPSLLPPPAPSGFAAFRRAARRGMTLLEVLLAVVIFALLGVVMLTTFRTGVRAYERAGRQSLLLDRARMIFDTVQRDVHNTYYLPESSYNNTLRPMIEQMIKELEKAEEEDDFDSFFRRYGDPDDPENQRRQKEEGEEQGESSSQDAYIGNPYEYGILLDLQMVGESREGSKTFSFVTYQPTHPGRPGARWGLQRVRYTVSGGVMVRATEPVFDPPRNIFGEILEEPQAYSQDILAEGVEEFDMRFGYWFDEVWIESDRWNSTRREMRNSNYLMTPDPDPELEKQLQDPDSQAYRYMISRMNQAPEDGLPAYVRLKLVLSDPEKSNYRETFQTMVRFPASMETYLPNAALDEERLDAEIRSRKEGQWGRF